MREPEDEILMPQCKAVKYEDRIALTVSKMEERRGRREDQRERYLYRRARL